jgi:hypothetical protein
VSALIEYKEASFPLKAVEANKMAFFSVRTAICSFAVLGHVRSLDSNSNSNYTIEEQILLVQVSLMQSTIIMTNI